MSNLARRQLNTAQRADMGLKLLEIEQARAKERQKMAGELIRNLNGRGIKTVGSRWLCTQLVQADD